MRTSCMDWTPSRRYVISHVRARRSAAAVVGPQRAPDTNMQMMCAQMFSCGCTRAKELLELSRAPQTHDKRVTTSPTTSCDVQVWSARDSINSVNCKPDSTNDGRLVYATCALSNYSLFWDFAGLRRLPPSDLTGIRLVRHAEVFLPPGCSARVRA